MGKQITTAAPGGAFIEWKDYKGKLLVIEPLEIEREIKTVHGVADATKANVYVLLGKDRTDEFEDCLVFPKVLQSQLKKHLGTGLVVGRLEQDIENQKRGQDPAWILAPGTNEEGDRKKAADFWTAKSMASAGSSVDEDDDDDYEDDEDSF